MQAQKSPLLLHEHHPYLKEMAATLTKPRAIARKVA
jgi:hypothetical protein